MMAQARRNHLQGRRPPVLEDNPGPPSLDTDMAEAQAADKDLGVLISALRDETGRPVWKEMSSASTEAKHYWSQWDLLRMHDGVLQRRWETANGSSQRWLVVVPRTLRSMIMEDNHDALTGGHFGIKKTLQLLRQRFYWIGMRHDVTE